MTDETIKALIEAGEKATQGEWKHLINTGVKRYIRAAGGLLFDAWKPQKYTGQDERYESELEETKSNCDFIAQAANARPALKALYAEVQELREKVKGMEGCVLVPIEFANILSETLDIARDWNAPDFYDIEVSEKYEHLKDDEGIEPNWLSDYKITDELKSLIAAAPKQEKE